MRSSLAGAFLTLVLVPFGAFCLVWTLRFLGRSEILSALLAFGFAVFALPLVALLGVVVSAKVVPRVTCDGRAITIRPDRKVDGLLMASTAGAFVAMTLYAIFAPLDMLDISVPRNNERYFVIVCAAAVFVGLFSLRQIIRRRGTSYLRLSVEGVETGNTMTSVMRPWGEIADVTDRPRKAKRGNGATYVITDDGHTREIPSNWYTPAGRALHEMVRFYWEHPQHRDELVDGRAVERLRAGV